ncbi:MAG: hypothetical protein PHO83_07500 [Geobacteraceae bacterium]|nr:hypothetical protein [Geobacteraceae bacterium]
MNGTGNNFRIISIILAATLLVSTTTVSAADKLVDSSDYSDKDFNKCIISDYSDMVDGDDIQWVWTDPSVKLSQYNLKVGKVENKSKIRSKSMVESVKSTFSETFADQDNKGKSGALTADICIYEAEHFSAGKAWIPFVGGHQMQAGMGVEMVLRNGSKKTVAKFRHSAREGAEIDAATQEVANDLLEYISDN